MVLVSHANEASMNHESALAVQHGEHTHAQHSAVSWPAILAGAAAAAALSLSLLLLGAGLGLSAVSPWAQQGVSSTTLGVSTIAWLALTQIVAAGMGGYLAGRLRTRWLGVHTDEVYFRDTAHGFLAWAVATLATALMLTSALGGMVNSGVQAAATLGSGAATGMVAGSIAAANTGQEDGAGMGYWIDTLFRAEVPANTSTALDLNTNATDNTPATAYAAENTTQNAGQNSTQNAPQSTAEVTRIFVNAIGMPTLPPADVTYLGQRVSARTGLSQQAAEARVTSMYSNMQSKAREAEVAAKATADKLRKVTIYSTLWLFASLLMGAFAASLAATWGGRCRDA